MARPSLVPPSLETTLLAELSPQDWCPHHPSPSHWYWSPQYHPNCPENHLSQVQAQHRHCSAQNPGSDSPWPAGKVHLSEGPYSSSPHPYTSSEKPSRISSTPDLRLFLYLKMNHEVSPHVSARGPLMCSNRACMFLFYHTRHSVSELSF